MEVLSQPWLREQGGTLAAMPARTRRYSRSHGCENEEERAGGKPFDKMTSSLTYLRIGGLIVGSDHGGIEILDVLRVCVDPDRAA
jgi:hypothetical protein